MVSSLALAEEDLPAVGSEFRLGAPYPARREQADRSKPAPQNTLQAADGTPAQLTKYPAKP